MSGVRWGLGDGGHVWGYVCAWLGWVQALPLLREWEEGDRSTLERKPNNPQVQTREFLLLWATGHTGLPGDVHMFYLSTPRRTLKIIVLTESVLCAGHSRGAVPSRCGFLCHPGSKFYQMFGSSIAAQFILMSLDLRYEIPWGWLRRVKMKREEEEEVTALWPDYGGRSCNTETRVTPKQSWPPSGLCCSRRSTPSSGKTTRTPETWIPPYLLQWRLWESLFNMKVQSWGGKNEYFLTYRSSNDLTSWHCQRKFQGVT